MTIVRVCTRDNERGACMDRHEAVRRDLMWFSWEMQGWFGLVKGIPEQMTTCPYCHGDLPTLTDATLRALENYRQADGADGYEGEDGG
ncbi:MAG TPA: hypothetical protein VFM71_08740 [Gemmatimonadaceae bacterium]|nr:hypothetical protein [Gemmatimonadaceae bacterium]